MVERLYDEYCFGILWWLSGDWWFFSLSGEFVAGAQTPMAGTLTAVGIAASTLYLTRLFELLPIVTLAATIMIAVLSFIDVSGNRRTWKYSRSNFTAMMLTLLVTLGIDRDSIV